MGTDGHLAIFVCLNPRARESKLKDSHNTDGFEQRRLEIPERIWLCFHSCKPGLRMKLYGSSFSF